jgi:hypothetical protein
MVCFILTQYRWLLSHGREIEALEVLAAIEAKPIDDPYVSTQHDEIIYSIQYERENTVRWRDLFRRNKTNDTKMIRRLLLGAGTQAMQQFQGETISRLNSKSVRSYHISQVSILWAITYH